MVHYILYIIYKIYKKIRCLEVLGNFLYQIELIVRCLISKILGALLNKIELNSYFHIEIFFNNILNIIYNITYNIKMNSVLYFTNIKLL